MGTDRNDGLKDKVAQWLDTQGYPLEMQVAREFLKERFTVRQSEYYEDPETKVAREADVIAYAQAELAGCLTKLTVCAECKVSNDKPWILLTSPQRALAKPARVVQRAASRLGAMLLQSSCTRRELSIIKDVVTPITPGL